MKQFNILIVLVASSLMITGCSITLSGKTDSEVKSGQKYDKGSKESRVISIRKRRLKQCLKRLKGTIERLGIRPDRKTRTKARRYCVKGDRKSAIRTIRTARKQAPEGRAKQKILRKYIDR